MRSLRAASLIAALASSLGLPAMTERNAAIAHPLHTSLAQVTIDSRKRTVEVSLKVFFDDLTKAAAGARLPVTNYALGTFTIVDGSGTKLPLTSCGEKRVGDLVWLCLRASTPRPLKSVGLSSRVLFDLYEDQINVVQTTVDGTRSSLLFTRGDGVKRVI